MPDLNYKNFPILDFSLVKNFAHNFWFCLHIEWQVTGKIAHGKKNAGSVAQTNALGQKCTEFHLNNAPWEQSPQNNFQRSVYREIVIEILNRLEMMKLQLLTIEQLCLIECKFISSSVHYSDWSLGAYYLGLVRLGQICCVSGVLRENTHLSILLWLSHTLHPFLGQDERSG